MQDRSEEPCISFDRELLLLRYPCTQVQLADCIKSVFSVQITNVKRAAQHACLQYCNPNLEGRFSRKLGISNTASLRSCRAGAPVGISYTLVRCRNNPIESTGLTSKVLCSFVYLCIAKHWRSRGVRVAVRPSAVAGMGVGPLRVAFCHPDLGLGGDH